tara:strand:+ start:269 stop:775 length:507 start_codon:yes stop_codon:yes gene_type:complete
MTPEQNEIYTTWVKLCTLLSEEGYTTDPRKMKEVMASFKTGCEPTKEKSGPDCYFVNEEGQTRPAERKSTTAKNIKGSYTGQSKQKSWEEQVTYTQKKIKSMDRHYFDKFCSKSGHILESWFITGDVAYEIILPQLEKYFSGDGHRADQRPAATISKGHIMDHGEKVL